ncbi:hypothetical protein ACQ1Q5_00275 [Ornithobacterium rhinotracheale]
MILKLKYITKATFFVALVSIFTSCDDKIGSLEELNSAPNFHIFQRNATSWQPVKEKVVYDSAKVWTEANHMTYSAVLKMEDINSNYGDVTIGTYDTDDTYYINSVEYNKTQRVPLDSFSVSYKNKNLGLREFDVTARDDFGKANKLKFYVFFAENKKPVARLNINVNNEHTENEYEIDASNSKDMDQSLGGFIKEYEYVINDKKIIRTSFNKIYHVFSPGDYIIRLRVKDNDDEWSNTVTKSLYVE